ncbi:MAG: TOBE domain-containing protein, partial [Xanthobacteraceae bacterium]|nr:TOBE domain-containing protein [Xanthobacteraceae bacterium]
ASSTVADFLGYSNIFHIDARKPVDEGIEIAFAASRTVLRAAGPAPDALELFACIRPQDIGISLDAAEASTSDNTLLGEVMLASFMGSFMQYRVRTDAGDVFEVFSNKISAEIKLGARVRLSFPRQAIHVLSS